MRIKAIRSLVLTGALFVAAAIAPSGPARAQDCDAACMACLAPYEMQFVACYYATGDYAGCMAVFQQQAQQCAQY